MSDKFDNFLKEHKGTPPPAPLGEKQRIWRVIEEQKSSRWLAWPQWRFFVPALAALAIVVVTLQVKKARHNSEMEKVLAHALAYQLEDNENEGLF